MKTLFKKEKGTAIAYSLFPHQIKFISDLSTLTKLNKSMIIRFFVKTGMTALKDLKIEQMKDVILHSEYDSTIVEFPLLKNVMKK